LLYPAIRGISACPNLKRIRVRAPAEVSDEKLKPLKEKLHKAAPAAVVDIVR
jgi:hypothetical protein